MSESTISTFRAVTVDDAYAIPIVMRSALESSDDRRLLQCFFCDKDFETLYLLEEEPPALICADCLFFMRRCDEEDALFPEPPEPTCVNCGSSQYEVVSDRLRLGKPDAICCGEAA